MLLTWAVSRSSGKGPRGTRGVGDGAALAGHAALSCLAEIYPIYICLVSWRQYRQGFLSRAMFCCWGSNAFFKQFFSGGRGVRPSTPEPPELRPSTPEPPELASTKPFCKEGKSWCGITKTPWGVHTEGRAEMRGVLLQLLLPGKPSRVWFATGSGGTTSPCPSFLLLAGMPGQGTDLAEDEHRPREDLCQIKAAVKPQPEGLCLHFLKKSHPKMSYPDSAWLHWQMFPLKTCPVSCKHLLEIN